MSNTGNRTIHVGGAWASLAAASGNIGAATIPSSMRINVKAATYASLGTTSVSFAGGLGILVWWRGYKTTPGDLDTVSLSAITALDSRHRLPAMDIYRQCVDDGLGSAKDIIISGIAMTSAITNRLNHNGQWWSEYIHPPLFDYRDGRECRRQCD